MKQKVFVLGAVTIDTNIYLYGKDIDFSVEANFSENIDKIGGAGGYSSQIFHHLNQDTEFIAYIGDDFMGSYIRDYFDSGTLKSHFFIDTKGTKRSINFVNLDGTRKNFYDGKGSMDIQPDLATMLNLVKSAQIIHFSIVNWTRYLLEEVKNQNPDVVVSTDLQDVVSLDDPYRLDYIKHSDIIFLSSTNIENLDNLVQKYQMINPDLIIVVGRGKDGAAVFKGSFSHHQPVIDLPDPVIDTNGAGDALACAFQVAYYIENKSIEEALFYAQIYARMICSIKDNNFPNYDDWVNLRGKLDFSKF